MPALQEFQPSLSPRFIAYVRDYLLDAGVNPAPLFRACALSDEDDDELGDPVPVGRICELFDYVARTLTRPYFGLELSRGYHYESSSLLIVAFMAAPTVREAFGALLRYDKFVDSAIETKLSHLGGLSCFEVNLLAQGQFNTEHLSEYLLSFIVHALNKATRQPFPATRVAFTHPAIKPTLPVQEVFNATVVYGAKQNALHFEEAFLDTPLHTANQVLYDVTCNALRAMYTRESGHYDFMEAVQRQVLLQFKEGQPTVESVSSALQISPRTLRRRLSEQGFKLQDVKNRARTERAKFYLQHTYLPLTEIAYEIGFSELSAFSRAFKAWTNETPQGFRDRFAVKRKADLVNTRPA